MRSSSNLRRDAARFRCFRRLQDGDVVAARHAAPCRRVVSDVNGVVLFIEHLAACDSGTVVHDAGGRGLYDREMFVSFRNAFCETRKKVGGGGYALMPKISANKMFMSCIVHCRRMF